MSPSAASFIFLFALLLRRVGVMALIQVNVALLPSSVLASYNRTEPGVWPWNKFSSLVCLKKPF